jgi:hypothetical protein
MVKRSRITAVLPLITLLSCSPEQERTPAARQAMPLKPNATEITTPGGAVSGRVDGGGQAGVRLNPPHGEPGHVCEIPVGQPLDGSTPGAQDRSITIPANGGGDNAGITISPQMAQPAAQGSGRINPPHGEPGHVCEIPVGEPLP